MNGTRWHFWLALLVLPLLSACSTPANQHYLLTANQGSVPSGSTPSLGIGPVTVSAYLHRDSLVQRSDGNRLAISSTERWAEPLDQGITRVLSLNLANLLQTQDVRSFPWHPRRPPDYGVKLNVLEMDSGPEGVRLVAEWMVYRVEDGSPLARRLSSEIMPLPGDTAGNGAIVQAYSDLLLQLSEEIAATIREAEQATRG